MGVEFFSRSRRVVHLLVLSQSSGGPSFETVLSYMPGSLV